MKCNVFTFRVLTGLILCASGFACNPALLQAQSSGQAGTSTKGGTSTQPQSQSRAQSQPQAQPQPEKLTAEQLQQIVAPIALYPDALVAQILAGSAYPGQIANADRFLQNHPDLKDAELGAEVDKQTWDPSVKALTQFPSVLANLDKNPQWTSKLGEANVSQQTDVLDAVQVMRQKAQGAGNLKSTPQQTVTTQEKTIIIQPANPQIVYVPEYDPGLVYGYRVGLWPGFHPWWGVWGGSPFLRFGVGFGMGPWGGFGWGWHAWGFNWGARGILYGGRAYAFRRAAYARGYARGVRADNRQDANERGNRGQAGAGRANGQAGGQAAGRSGNASGTHTGTAGGANHSGAQTHANASHVGTGNGAGKRGAGGAGRAGGAGHAGGGAGHAGGGHGGGGRR